MAQRISISLSKPSSVLTVAEGFEPVSLQVGEFSSVIVQMFDLVPVRINTSGIIPVAVQMSGIIPAMVTTSGFVPVQVSIGIQDSSISNVFPYVFSFELG